MGLGPYMLPAGFAFLPPGQQLFVLVNLDRLAYGLQPISGMNSSLDAASYQGMLTDTDPTYPADLPSGWFWVSNVAYGFDNVLFAYYFWMYADGYGYGNIACTTPASAGCWGHRDNILAFPDSTAAAMGAAVGKDYSGRNAYAMEIANAQANGYRWAQALADGAGPSSATPTTATTITPTTATTATISVTTASGGSLDRHRLAARGHRCLDHGTRPRHRLPRHRGRHHERLRVARRAVVMPSIARVLARKHAVRLKWSVAGSGARPTAFKLRYSQTGYPLAHFRRLAPSSRSALVTGLTSHVSYRFVLVARRPEP